MRKLHRSEWFEVAQRLPTGGTVRIHHRSDNSSRPNLVVSNKGDRWVAYCQACKEGDRVMKTHTKWGERAPVESTYVDYPSDLVTWGSLSAEDQTALTRWLLSKGVTPDILRGCEILYSKRRARICFRPEWGEAVFARDLTGASMIKWITYGKAPTYYLQGVDGGHERSIVQGQPLIITEDLLSMYKVAYAVLPKHPTWAVAWSMGTDVSTEFLSALVMDHLFSDVVVFYDGDKAGEEGATRVRKRLDLVLPKTNIETLNPPRGLDPKDLPIQSILEMLESVVWTD